MPSKRMKSKRILIVQTAFLGDVILTTPLIRAVKELFPDSFISFLLIPETKRVLENNPHINEVLVYDKRGKRGAGAFLGIVTEVRKRRFDLALVPHRSFRSALLTSLAGIPIRIGFDTSAGAFLLNRKVHYRSDVHEVERNLSLISQFNSTNRDFAPEMFPSPHDLASVHKMLAESNVREQDKIVAVAPGSVWPTKRWLPERFAQVCDLLISRAGAKIVLLGSEHDLVVCRQILSLMKEKPVVLAGTADVLLSAAAISLCSVVISGDSAPVHMASAMRKPVVAIFGSTVPEFGFSPYRVDDVIVQKKLDCRPCGIHGKRKCRREHFKCMKEITADEVFKATLSLI
jgi:heptosyltransferase-2